MRLQIAGFCMSAAYSARMLVLFLKLDSKVGVWTLYGTFTSPHVLRLDDRRYVMDCAHAGAELSVSFGKRHAARFLQVFVW